MSLSNQFFFHDSIRKYIVAFGDLFDKLYVSRYNVNGTFDHQERVPITYSAKEKWYVRDNEDPGEDKQISIKLPRMGFEFVGMQYDASKKLQTLNSVSTQSQTSPTSSSKQFTPVPYTMEMKLWIMTKHQIEGNQLVEQILPFFSPDWSLTINAIPEMCLYVNVPITLNSIEKEDNYEGTYIDRRVIIWTLSFTIQAYIFPPTMDSAVIKQTIVNLRAQGVTAQITGESITGTVTLPGKTYQQILPTDPYGYSINIKPIT